MVYVALAAVLNGVVFLLLALTREPYWLRLASVLASLVAISGFLGTRVYYWKMVVGPSVQSESVPSRVAAPGASAPASSAPGAHAPEVDGQGQAKEQRAVEQTAENRVRH